MGDLPESTVRKFKNLYTSELSASAKRSEYSDVTALPPKKRGRLLLWERSYTMMYINIFGL